MEEPVQGKKASLEEKGEVNGWKEKPCVGGEIHRAFGGYMKKSVKYKKNWEVPEDIVLLFLVPFPCAAREEWLLWALANDIHLHEPASVSPWEIGSWDLGWCLCIWVPSVGQGGSKQIPKGVWNPFFFSTQKFTLIWRTDMECLKLKYVCINVHTHGDVFAFRIIVCIHVYI